MERKLNFTTTTTIISTQNASGILSRLDYISVIILGIVIAICTLICCFVGFKRRKIVPNESQVVDVQNANDVSDAFVPELRHSEHTRNVESCRGPRAPDSPPPTYSVLERQTSFTSYISQSSSQFEIPPNYEEAAGLTRAPLMATLIPEEGSTATTIMSRDCNYRKSDSAKHHNFSHAAHTTRSKSDVGRTKRQRRTPVSSQTSSDIGRTRDTDTNSSRHDSMPCSPQTLLKSATNKTESTKPLLSPTDTVTKDITTSKSSAEAASSSLTEPADVRHSLPTELTKEKKVILNASTDV